MSAPLLLLSVRLRGSDAMHLCRIHCCYSYHFCPFSMKRPQKRSRNCVLASSV